MLQVVIHIKIIIKNANYMLTVYDLWCILILTRRQQHRRNKTMKTLTVTEVVNNMTSEQYLNMLNTFFGEVPQEIQDLSDEELLAELLA